MSFYNDFSISSQFSYGASHIVAGAKSIAETPGLKSKLKGLEELCLGVIEMIPVIGLVPAYFEKKFLNWSIDDRLNQREHYVNREIQSTSFQMQGLYFDTYSSSRMKEGSLTQELKVFDNSNVDLQLYSLRGDLEEFQKQNPSPVFGEVMKKLDDAKRTALLISNITTSNSAPKKEDSRMALEEHLKTRITNLTEGESIIIPSGYMNGNIYDLDGLKNGTVSGHAILLKLMKEPDGTYTIKVYNTGEGFELHGKDANKTDRIFPFVISEISEEKLVNGSFLKELTGFSYNDGQNKKYASKDVYDCISKIGNRKEDTSNERSYHTQRLIGNCTKKSLQVWLHEELRGDDKTYQAFRVFRMDRNIAAAKAHLETQTPLKYAHPLVALGGSKGANVAVSIARRAAGFFLGSRIKVKVSNQSLNHLTWYAKQLNIIRSQKAEGAENRSEEVPLYIFRENQSTPEIIKEILASPGKLPIGKNTLLESFGTKFVSTPDFKTKEVLDLLNQDSDKIAFLKGGLVKLVEENRLEEAVKFAKKINVIKEDSANFDKIIVKMLDQGEVAKAIDIISLCSFTEVAGFTVEIVKGIEKNDSNEEAIKLLCRFDNLDYKSLALQSLSQRIDRMITDGKLDEVIKIGTGVAAKDFKSVIFEKVVREFIKQGNPEKANKYLPLITNDLLRMRIRL